MDETTITQLGGQTNAKYQLKVLLLDSFLTEGVVSYRIQRYTRTDASQAWAVYDTWSTRKTQFQAIVQEGNVAYVKLAFPLFEGKTWNGNALNNIGGTDKCTDGTFNCDNYVVADMGKAFNTSAASYNDSVTIIENNDSDPIVKKDVRKSVYVRSTGLVYKEITTLEYCTIGSCIGQQVVENGYILKQTLKDHGSS